MTAASTSIRRRLLLSTAGVLAVVIGAAAAIAWRVGLNAAENAYDRSLLDPAIALAASVRGETHARRVELSEDARAALMVDAADVLVYAISDEDGRLLAGDAGLPAPASAPEPGRPRFYDAERDRVPLRVAALRTGTGLTVLVGETRNKRNRLVVEVLVAALVPTLLVAIAAVVLLRGAIGRALAPLDRVRDDLAARAPGDLQPLDARGAPDEVRPAVEALNHLIERLRVAADTQQRFVANAAHQLRTPLAALRVRLDLALREEDPWRQREILAGAVDVLSRASHMVHRLLTLSRVDREAEDGAPKESVDLDRLAREEVESWIDRALARGVDLGYEGPGAPVVVPARDSLLREALSNLLDNAFVHAGSAGPVTVGVTDRPPGLFVEDHGPGIPEGERELVKGRFYRIPGTAGEGCGLGLAIVDEIARIHGARLVVAARGTGPGTRVALEFPPAG